MKNEKFEEKKLATLLRRLADLIDRGGIAQIEMMVAKDFNRESVSTYKKKPIAKRLASDRNDWLQIANQLRSLGSREEGQRLLDQLSPTRAGLEHLARAMNLPVSKQDNAQRLKDKIVEFGIGSRLSSRAIRGD